jgi:hypothetical protein
MVVKKDLWKKEIAKLIPDAKLDSVLYERVSAIKLHCCMVKSL